MSMAWVRKNYRVPAKRGGRVEYTGEGKPELGTIRSASGGYVHIQLDGVKRTMPFHPTWELRYLDGSAEVST
jgi:hypothetical protein